MSLDSVNVRQWVSRGLLDATREDFVDIVSMQLITRKEIEDLFPGYIETFARIHMSSETDFSVEQLSGAFVLYVRDHKAEIQELILQLQNPPEALDLLMSNLANQAHGIRLYREEEGNA